MVAALGLGPWAWALASFELGTFDLATLRVALHATTRDAVRAPSLSRLLFDYLIFRFRVSVCGPCGVVRLSGVYDCMIDA